MNSKKKNLIIGVIVGVVLLASILAYIIIRQYFAPEVEKSNPEESPTVQEVEHEHSGVDLRP
ncbi:MAG: hypothetical protein ACLFUS_06465 [Candidatus Sumerlaeia bacterium]